VSRRNYKPVERLLERIHTLKSKRNDIPSGRQDEFTMIEAALDKMAEESSFYEKQVEENKIYRRQVQVQDLLEGRHSSGTDTWLSEREEWGSGIGSKQHVVAVAEIDRYHWFSRSYPSSDQNLLKYSLEKTIGEIASGYSVPIWTEWVAGNRLAIIIQQPQTTPSDRVPDRICNEAREWVQDNLPLTVTFGLGDIVDGLQLVSISYKTALSCLDYKPSLGNNQLITISDTQARPQADMFRHVQLVRPFASAYKRGEEQWKGDCLHFFTELKKGAFTRDDLISMMNYMIYYFHREMMEHTSELRTLWETEAMPGLTSMLDEDETLEEVEQRFTRILTDLYHKIILIRERRNNHMLMKQVRDYIEEHYGDADMSLTYLSDQFGINGKYLSRLFKEEFGENFGEHLMQVRMEHAKSLLLESAASINDIAEKVGYTTSIAFIRVFKKVAGTTPGEYRKNGLSRTSDERIGGK
jgi:AraC-like DNA-binding protein